MESAERPEKPAKRKLDESKKEEEDDEETSNRIDDDSLGVSFLDDLNDDELEAEKGEQFANCIDISPLFKS
jgi:hypothetical protein